MERIKITFKDLVVSSHFSKFSTSRSFYKAFGCRVRMLLNYQMISVYQLCIVEGHMCQTKTEATDAIATIPIITIVVFLTAPLISGSVFDKIYTRKVPIIIVPLLFAIGIVVPWIMPSVMGMHLYMGVAGSGYGVYSATDQAFSVDMLLNKEEAGKGLDILNLATTLGQVVGPITASVVKATIGTYTPAFATFIVVAVCAAVFVSRIQKVK